MNMSFYKCCAVPTCKSTSIRTPEKLFITVPKCAQIRRKWLTLAKRHPSSMSLKSSCYFCEDHFDLQNDMENYVQYTTMGVVPRIRMRPGCLPSKFASPPKRTATGTSAGVRRPVTTKKLKQALKNERAEEITVTFQHENLNIDVLGQDEGSLDEEQKLSKSYQAAQEADESGTIRAGRGRPRKKNIGSIGEYLQKGQEAVVSGTVRAGRGRPRKTHTYSFGVDLEIKQEQSDIAGDAGDVFEPGTSYSSEPLGSGYVDDPGALSPIASEVSTNGNEIKVFCPKCNTEVSHTAEGIQQDQTKILIAKVYRYFEQEYDELKKIYGALDLTPLSNFCQRTALATGVSEAMLMQILKEQERRNEERQREPPQEERAARKRRRQTTHNSSEEDSSDDNVEDIEQPSPPEETLVVKIEPPECNIEEPEILMAVKVEPSDDDTNKEQTDPIALDMKPEQQADDEKLDNTDATPASETSAATIRKAKKIPRLGDETSVQQQTQAECSSSAASRSKRRATEESSQPGEVEIKLERADEEGFS